MQSAVHVPEVTGPEFSRDRDDSTSLRAVQVTAVSCFHRVYRPRDGYCDSRGLMTFSRPRGLWAPMRYPVLSGSPLHADLHTTTIATI